MFLDELRLFKCIYYGLPNHNWEFMKEKMATTIQEQIERNKIKAEMFLTDGTRAFIIDIGNTYHFCKIISVDERSIHVKNFKEKRPEKEEKILFVDIIKFEEYKEKNV